MRHREQPLYKGPCFNPMLILFDLRDKDDLSTKDTCFNTLDLQDRDDLSTRDKIIGPIVSRVRRFHCMMFDS